MPNTTAKAIEAEHKAKTTHCNTTRHTSRSAAAFTTASTSNKTYRQANAEGANHSQYNRSRQDQWLLGSKEGRFWKRVHVKPRTTYYVPTQSDGGPNHDNLLPTRMTMVYPTNGSRGKRVDDNWTAEPQPEEPTTMDRLNKLWGKGAVQGATRVRRRGTPTSNQSKGSNNAIHANTTGSTGAQPHAPSI